ncbi:protein FAM92A [Puma concolor]|uniref:Protein FAM92A n=1 Tax=Puma concolor TaxID=9696 RepID=A0A6P6HS98_PUMCO|nr:protein FAM92A [Puma concolor]
MELSEISFIKSTNRLLADWLCAPLPTVPAGGTGGGLASAALDEDERPSSGHRPRRCANRTRREGTRGPRARAGLGAGAGAPRLSLAALPPTQAPSAGTRRVAVETPGPARRRAGRVLRLREAAARAPLCQIFAAYVRKTARLRDKADLLVNEINVYASTETPNLKQGLKNFAEEFAKLQDYRQAEVERLEAKVVEPLKAYGTIVKMKRDDLKATLTARNREAKQLTQLERTRQRNPSDRHVISQAETELQRATMDATRTTRHLEETIDNFEKQKIKDIKTIFSEFITIEMLFHGKALEVYTAAYQNIQKIDEEEDLEVFRNSLYPPDYSSRLDIVRANSKSPLQRSLSAKCVSGTGQVSTCRLRKDQQADDDEEDEDLDVTEEEN